MHYLVRSASAISAERCGIFRVQDTLSYSFMGNFNDNDGSTT